MWNKYLQQEEHIKELKRRQAEAEYKVTCAEIQAQRMRDDINIMYRKCLCELLFEMRAQYKADSLIKIESNSLESNSLDCVGFVQLKLIFRMPDHRVYLVDVSLKQWSFRIEISSSKNIELLRFKVAKAMYVQNKVFQCECGYDDDKKTDHFQCLESHITNIRTIRNYFPYQEIGTFYAWLKSRILAYLETPSLLETKHNIRLLLHCRSLGTGPFVGIPKDVLKIIVRKLIN